MTQNARKFHIGEVVRTAWSKVKGSKGPMFPFVLLFLIYRFVDIINTLATDKEFSHYFAPSLTTITDILLIPLMILAAISALALIYMGVQRALDTPLRSGMVRDVLKWRTIFRAIGVILLMFLFMIPAIILAAVIPGILSKYMTMSYPIILRLLMAVSILVGVIYLFILVLRFSLVLQVAVMQRVNSWQAVKISWNATKSNVWRLFGLDVINMLIVFVSAIPLGIGLFWSLPYSYITYGEVYKKLVAGEKVA